MEPSRQTSMETLNSREQPTTPLRVAEKIMDAHDSSETLSHDPSSSTSSRPLSYAEKGGDQDTARRSQTTVTQVRATGAPLEASPPIDVDWSQHTLRKRLWRSQVTEFARIAEAKYRGSGTDDNPFIVKWLDDDPENPKSYGIWKKIFVSGVMAFSCLCVSLASSAYTGAARQIVAEFHCSEEVFLLGLSMMVLGFALGPLMWAPLSEALGRRNLAIVSLTIYIVWTGVCAAAPNMAALIVFRFLCGVFGSSVYVIPAGVIADLFEAEQRGVVLAIFAAAPFLGPALGPIIAGFLSEAQGWRWVILVLALYAAVLTLLAVVFVPETYAPVLLRARAKTLSAVSGRVYKTQIDVEQPLVLRQLVRKALVLPWALLIHEPIVLLLSIYMSVIYGTLYLCFAAFPIVFQEGRGWSPGLGGLAFSGLMVGIFAGIALTVFDNIRYTRLHRATGGFAPPETRLPLVMIGGAVAVVGLAWLAATTDPAIHWIVPILAEIPFGMGFLLIFMGCTNYLIDSYVIYAASVMAANSVLRSLFGTVFPLFTTYMYRNLGTHWATAVPGFIALACVPFPIIFYKYGPAIRRKCKYSAQAAHFLDALRSDLERQQSRASQPPVADEVPDRAEAGGDKV